MSSFAADRLDRDGAPTSDLWRREPGGRRRRREQQGAVDPRLPLVGAADVGPAVRTLLEQFDREQRVERCGRCDGGIG